jgi:hypothetical protein
VLKPQLILFIFFPRDIRREPILQTYLPFVRWQKRRPPTPSATRFLPSRVDLSPAVHVGTGIDRILEDSHQHATVRAVPDKFPQGRQDPLADANLDSFLVERPEHAMEGPDAPKLLKHQPHHSLHFFVWVQGHFPRRQEQITRRHGHRERPAAGFLHLPRMESLPKDVKLCLGHGPL